MDHNQKRRGIGQKQKTEFFVFFHLFTPFFCHCFVFYLSNLFYSFYCLVFILFPFCCRFLYYSLFRSLIIPFLYSSFFNILFYYSLLCVFIIIVIGFYYLLFYYLISLCLWSFSHAHNPFFFILFLSLCLFVGSYYVELSALCKRRIIGS